VVSGPPPTAAVEHSGATCSGQHQHANWSAGAGVLWRDNALRRQRHFDVPPNQLRVPGSRTSQRRPEGGSSFEVSGMRVPAKTWVRGSHAGARSQARGRLDQRGPRASDPVKRITARWPSAARRAGRPAAGGIDDAARADGRRAARWSAA